jgi:hypothetical protein
MDVVVWKKGRRLITTLDLLIRSSVECSQVGLVTQQHTYRYIKLSPVELLSIFEPQARRRTD